MAILVKYYTIKFQIISNLVFAILKEFNPSKSFQNGIDGIFSYEY